MTIEDVNLKLQEQASRMGANAVIQVQYDRGMSLTSYKVLKAKGIAVVLESDEVKCPLCAELIKREAVKCKHCGSALGVADVLPRQEPKELKEELFQLEADHVRGRISQQQYEKTKAALVQRLDCK
jgi:hypothetical protein